MGEPSRPPGRLRVLPGMAWVIGATITLYPLLTTGMTDLTVWATTATLLFVILSRRTSARVDRNG